MNDYGKIMHELKLMQAQISTIDMTSKTIDGWVPRKFVKKFFDIGDTTMTALEKSGKLIVSKVGNKKIYYVKSIVNLIESNIVSN